MIKTSVKNCFKAHDPPNEKLRQLINLYQKGKFQEIVDIVPLLIKNFPNSFFLYNISGVSNIQLGYVEVAIKNFKHALKINPNNAVVYNNIGNALKELGKLNDAINAYMKAIKIKPDYFNAFFNIGNAFKENANIDADNFANFV